LSFRSEAEESASYFASASVVALASEVDPGFSLDNNDFVCVERNEGQTRGQPDNAEHILNNAAFSRNRSNHFRLGEHFEIPYKMKQIKRRTNTGA
jgi:hypothetical protein